jgi:DNA methylase
LLRNPGVWRGLGVQKQRLLIAAALDKSPVSGLTHKFYKYPARFSSVLVQNVIGALSEPGDLILDPFMGSGTTLVEALAQGRSAIGADISSLATFVSQAKTTRITNGIDALFEQRVDPNVRPPSSARDAVQSWFGRPIPIHDEQTARWYRPANLDRRVNVVMLPGDDSQRPTVDVMDNGIGITPDKFSKTILSLHQGNKIDKFYQVGLFGQGGSTPRTI